MTFQLTVLCSSSQARCIWERSSAAPTLISACHFLDMFAFGTRPALLFDMFLLTLLGCTFKYCIHEQIILMERSFAANMVQGLYRYYERRNVLTLRYGDL